MNNYTAIGRVGGDPDVKFFESGSQLAEFRIAIDKGGDTPVWVPCKAWKKTAEIVADYVRKGSQIGIEGRLDCDVWEDRETGKQRTKLYVLVSRVTLLGKKGDRQESDGESSHANASTDNFDDTPF